MSVLDIVRIPEPVLRRKARKVSDFGPELQTLVDDMITTMREAPGVGLAAPQVNMPLRVVVVEYKEDEDEEAPAKLYSVINPEITRMSTETEMGVEGCLSVPDFIGEVVRPLQVTIKGQSRRGQPLRIKAEGWLARIFQHEIDHLDGILFTDRAERIWKPETEEEKAIAAD